MNIDKEEQELHLLQEDLQKQQPDLKVSRVLNFKPYIQCFFFEDFFGDSADWLAEILS